MLLMKLLHLLQQHPYRRPLPGLYDPAPGAYRPHVPSHRNIRGRDLREGHRRRLIGERLVHDDEDHLEVVPNLRERYLTSE